MFRMNDPGQQGEADRTERDIERDEIVAFEKALARLVDEGYLKLPGIDLAQVRQEEVQPSAEAKRIGEQVRMRVLARLGLPNLGTYFAHERKARGLGQAKVAQSCGLSRGVIGELETERLPFYGLPVARAADLVQTLQLDPEIVLFYLRGLDLSATQLKGQMLNSFYRGTDKGSVEETRNIEDASQSQVSRSPQKQLEQFLRGFRGELLKRGLME